MGCIFWTSQLPNVLRAEALGVFWLLNVLRATVAYTFSHLNFQKCSDNEVSLASSLQNLLRTTTACNFSSLILPDGSAPAALASLLFDPPEPQNIGKTQCFATFLPFRTPASTFFWLFLFSDLLSSSFLFSLSLLWFSFFFLSLLWLFPPLLFHLSISTEVWVLNSLRQINCYAVKGESECQSTSDDWTPHTVGTPWWLKITQINR